MPASSPKDTSPRDCTIQARDSGGRFVGRYIPARVPPMNVKSVAMSTEVEPTCSLSAVIRPITAPKKNIQAPNQVLFATFPIACVPPRKDPRNEEIIRVHRELRLCQSLYVCPPMAG